MTFLNKFLGTTRWQALRQALSRESAARRSPELPTAMVVLAVIVALVPVLLTVADTLSPSAAGTLPTMGFGICAVLAIVIRWRLKLPFFMTKSWKETFSLTHTAVALGCIPAVALLLLAPELLAERHDVLTEAVRPEAAERVRPTIASTVLLVLAIAAWVAVVEEVLFRGLVVSVVRRWKLLPVQRHRDILAAVLSATIFGIAHYATWGPIASVALVGLGLGFVLGYIANGEQLVPLVIYHFVFDALSISVSIFL